MKALTAIDFNKNQLQNIVVHKLASAPSNPAEGQLYFNTTDDKLYFYDGTTWVATSGSSGSSLTGLTVTLTVAGWSNNTQTVTAQGVTASNIVFVSPNPSTIDDYIDCGVKCTAQGTNSLTFECASTPENAITVNVALFNGEYSSYFVGSSTPSASLGTNGDIYLRE